MEEQARQRGIGSFAASIMCGVAGLGLGVGGVLQLGVGLYNLAYPSAWQVPRHPTESGLGPPAIATPDTVWMSPIASNAQNLLIVSLASVAGICLLVAARYWFGSAIRPAIVFSMIGAAFAGIFILRLMSI